MSQPERDDPRFSAEAALFAQREPEAGRHPDAAGRLDDGDYFREGPPPSYDDRFASEPPQAGVPSSQRRQPLAARPRQRQPADPLDVLKRIYGYPAFRGKQADVVEHVVSGGDAVVLFPTGAGKSLCFQIPALCRDGIGVVVSPLIALMRDQVQALKQLGVNAAALNSSISREEAQTIYRDIRSGTLDLLYMTPERILTDNFRQTIGDARIALFAIDEAHCFHGMALLPINTRYHNPLESQALFPRRRNIHFSTLPKPVVCELVGTSLCVTSYPPTRRIPSRIRSVRDCGNVAGSPVRNGYKTCRATARQLRLAC